ncbi:MAG: M48 family metalloprotease [Fibrella sp.]|nr:M48 family metalloprotease [Armatimonadota bacterium]
MNNFQSSIVARWGRVALATFGVAWLGGVAATPFAFADDKPAAKKEKAPKPPAEDPEVKLGRETHEDLLRSGLKLVKDPAILTRVETIGKKVAAVANAEPIPASYGSSKHVPYEYRFFVVDDDDVNAFSLPGGFIYINKGILRYAQSDDELAGIIGHEIAHAAHHHVAKLQREQSRLNTQMAIGLLAALVARVPTADTMNLMTGFQLIALQKVNGFGQDAERDADHAGVILAKQSGYNPVGSLTFMERLGRDQKQRPDVELGIFRTHPPEKERSGLIEAQIVGMGLPVNRREVTNTLRVQVRSVSASKEGETQPIVGNSEVLLDGKLLYRTPSADRAKEVAASINELLDKNLQIYDLTRKGASVYAKGKAVISVQDEDVTAYASSPTPVSAETAADSAFKTLRNALYRHLLNGSVY